MNRVILGLGICLSTCAGCQSFQSMSQQVSSMGMQRVEIPSLPQHATADADAPDLPKRKEIELHTTMGKEMEKAGHYREAIHCYEKVRSLDPKSPGLAWKLAMLYARNEEFDRAKVEFQAALEVEPNNSDLLNDVGYSCYQSGKWEEAEGWFRKALEVSPQNTRAQVNLGLAVGQQGKFQAAYDLFKPAVGEAHACHNIGMLYMAQKRQGEARAALQRALTLDPNLAVTKAALEKLDKAASPADAVVQATANEKYAAPDAPKAAMQNPIVPVGHSTPVSTATSGEMAPPEWKPSIPTIAVPSEPIKIKRTLRLRAPVSPSVSGIIEPEGNGRKPTLGRPTSTAS